MRGGRIWTILTDIVLFVAVCADFITLLLLDRLVVHQRIALSFGTGTFITVVDEE